MGAFQSLFTYNETFSSKDCEDVKSNPVFLEKMTTIDKTQLSTALPLCDLSSITERIVDYIENYLDTSKLIAGHHSDYWKDDTVFSDSSVERRPELLNIVSKILDISDEKKKDKTLGDYLKKVLSNLTVSELGGFKIKDFRENKSTKALSYLRSRKQFLMSLYLSKIKTNGFVFCPEHDQDIIEGVKGLKSFRLNPEVHVGNMAKVIYYHESLTITELTKEEVIAQMTEKGYSADDFETYEDRFSIVKIQGPDETLFESGFIAMCVHLKSAGNKKDLTEKILPEYAFMKTVIKSYEGNFILMGDFNAPIFEEGIEYFGLEERDRLNYPIQESGVDSPYLLTYGFTRVGTYSTGQVGIKERSGNCAINCQAPRGKAGARQYYTDGVWIRTSIELDMSSQLYPPPRLGEPLILPRIDGTDDGDWFSDHQAIETKINGTFIGVCNVLSDCCSDDQPFKEELSGDQVEEARVEMNELIAELTTEIVNQIDTEEETDC